MSVVSMWVGATTPDGATFAVVVDGGGPVRVAVATDAAMTSPVFTGSQAVDATGAAIVSITGLTAGTRHWWQVEDNSTLDTSVTGQFLTFPAAGTQASFTVGMSGDAGLSPTFPGTAGGELDANTVSNHPIHATIRARALAEGWLGFYHLGDWGYPDWGDNLTDTLANRRTFYGDNLAQPNQGPLFRDIPTQYVWDDHDFAANNSDGTYANKTNGATVYRERVPAYPLPDAEALYQSWQIGRVLFVLTDQRYYKSPSGNPDNASKTMLGSAQKTWLTNLLATSDAKLLVWLQPGEWMGTVSDTWAAYQTEQAELVALFDTHGWLPRVCIVGADAHMVALDSGANSPGSIPVLQAAALDASPTGNPNIYSLGGQSAREQYGTVTVQDLGTHLTVTLAGWQGTGQLVSHSFTVAGDPPTPPSTGALHRTLAGTHRVLVEARVLTSWQTGDDPQGTQIPILGGDVRLDGTADILGSLIIETEGKGMWPRRASDLLAPFGNEIWVRRGVDLGPSVDPLWFPLGYFRIDTPEQPGSPHMPIRLTCTDRMAGIIEGELLAPREFAASRTYQSVFDELVQEIYPLAVVIFDDHGSEALGRTVVAEQSRYRILRDLADSLGKRMYWDEQGFMRVEAAPDPASPVWDVFAGDGGVLIELDRAATRVGVFNAVVAIGEAADDDDPVRALAVDANPLSPTFFGGRFGRVPFFYASPLLTTAGQAAVAAASKLRRLIGLPYQVDFRSIVNPALRPYQPIRTRDRDGNRELHIVETLTIPLTAGVAMTATTREQALVRVEV